MSEHAMSHESISAFIDNEPFDARALADALSTPDGRELLIDLIALRHVVAADPAVESHGAPRTTHSRWRMLAMAATIAGLALGGGYVAGQRSGAKAVVSSIDAPPAPTKVIELTPGVNWHPNQTQGER
jgi:hypothetical protein